MPSFKSSETAIKGLHFLNLETIKDDRGALVEGYNFEKLQSLGVLPESFQIRQVNVVENHWRTTRGIHAGEGHKYVMPLSGSIFAAWVDMREGKDFGKIVYKEMEKGDAAIIPQGVGNSFQVIGMGGSKYLYLISDTWKREGAKLGLYRGVNLFDEDLNIPWPIGLDEGAIVSEKDRRNPPLKEVKPFTLMDLKSLE